MCGDSIEKWSFVKKDAKQHPKFAKKKNVVTFF